MLAGAAVNEDGMLLMIISLTCAKLICHNDINMSIENMESFLLATQTVLLDVL